MQKTSKDLYDALKKYGTSLFDKLDTHKWYQYYIERHAELDRLYLNKIYKSLIIDEDIASTLSSQSELDKSIEYMSSVMGAFDELDRIFDVYQLEYDPIANVSGVEVTTHSGTDTHRYINVTENQSQNGKMQVENTGHDDNLTNGSQSTLNAVNPNLEYSNVVNRDKSTTEYNNLKTTTTYNNASTTDYQNVTSDRVKNGSENEEYGHVITLERNGNIGVTSTQELATQEIRLREQRFFDYLFHLWATWFTTGIYKLDCEERSCCDIWY